MTLFDALAMMLFGRKARKIERVAWADGVSSRICALDSSLTRSSTHANSKANTNLLFVCV